jgi:sirohydrochlorin ferrochelatase
VRPARLIPLVAVAHGSKDPRAAATVSLLAEAVRERAPGLDVRAAFLDHSAPSLPQVLASLAPGAGHGPAARCECVALPLLLTAAYHSKSDIPAQLAAAVAARPGLDVVSAGTLGPHPLLLTALERRLREAGVAAGSPAQRALTSVVLAAAGSSDPSANATIAALAAHWRSARGWRDVVPAYASAAGPRPAEAVRALRDAGAGRVVVATYLLSPGYFADKVRDGALGAGADVVGEPLGAAPEVAEVVLGRYQSAAAAAVARPAVARAQLSVLSSPLGTCLIGGNRRGMDAWRAAAPLTT